MMSFEITALELREDGKMVVFYDYTHPLDLKSKEKYPDNIYMSVASTKDQIVKKIQALLRKKFAEDFFGMMIEPLKEEMVGKSFDIYPQGRNLGED